MNELIDLRQLNLLCFYYLQGRLSDQEEKQLKEQLKKNKAIRLWFDWLLLKWLKNTWMRKRLVGKK